MICPWRNFRVFLVVLCRNETYCIAGSVTLHVYDSSSIDMDKLSYPWTASAGERVTLTCPSVTHFNWTDHIEWFMVSGRNKVVCDGVFEQVCCANTQYSLFGLLFSFYTVSSVLFHFPKMFLFLPPHQIFVISLVLVN